MTPNPGPELDADIADEDRDLPPMTEEELERAIKIPRVKTMRRILRLTQEEFSAKYLIPLGTLRDWEQSRVEPDATARAYILAIAGDPEGVARSLERRPRRPESVDPSHVTAS